MQKLSVLACSVFTVRTFCICCNQKLNLVTFVGRLVCKSSRHNPILYFWSQYNIISSLYYRRNNLLIRFALRVALGCTVCRQLAVCVTSSSACFWTRVSYIWTFSILQNKIARYPGFYIFFNKGKLTIKKAHKYFNFVIYSYFSSINSYLFKKELLKSWKIL